MEIITVSIGNELMRGDIYDTNMASIAKKIAPSGLSIAEHTTIGDDPAALKNCFNNLKNRKCTVLVTGGLGPTDDDLTREILAKIGKKNLSLMKKHGKTLKEYLKSIKRQ